MRILSLCKDTKYLGHNSTTSAPYTKKAEKENLYSAGYIYIP